MKRALHLTACMAFIATSAAADGLTYGQFNFDHTEVDSNFFTHSTITNGAVEYEINNFLLSADITNRRHDRTDGSSATDYKIGAGYFITPEILIGAGLLPLRASFGETNGYEAYAQYRNNTYGVAINAEQRNVDSNFTFYSLMGEYNFSPQVTVGARIQHITVFDGTSFTLSSEYNDGPINLRGYYNGVTDANAGTLGARGYYNFTNDIRGFASYQTRVGSDATDVDFYLIGGGYRFADSVWVDATFGQSNGGGFISAEERFGISINFETGTRQRLDDIFEQDIFDDGQSGFALFPT